MIHSRRVRRLALLAATLAVAASLPRASDAQILLVRVGDPPFICLDPEREIVPGILEAAICRPGGLLDDPIDLYLPLATRTRAGFIHGQLVRQLMRAARPILGEVAFAELSSRPPLDPPFALPLNHSLARALTADIARAERAGDVAGAVALRAQLDAFAMAVVGVPFAETQNARFDELLPPRAERDRDADVFSPGFLVLPAANTVGESSIGMADAFSGNDRLTGLPIGPQGVDSVPFFIGPDRRRHTADDLPTVACPDPATSSAATPGADGRCATGATNAENEPLYYVIAAGAGSQPACDAVLPFDTRGTNGGLNANGECVLLSIYGQVIGGFPSVGFGQGTLAALDKLLDPAFRPPEARLEPTDLTDLRLRASGSRIPARPPSPGGAIQFPESGAPFARRVDPATGAPVAATGPLSCVVRTDSVQPVGPDAIPGTIDDATPSVGNCLLFDNPLGNEAQVLRSPAAIAASHSADQTLFALLATRSFDEDAGQSGLDQTNDFTFFTAIASGLGGNDLIAAGLAEGYQLVRPPATDPTDPFDKAHLTEIGRSFGAPAEVFDRLFGDLPGPTPPSFVNEGISRASSVPAQALLGCGLSFASPCDEFAAAPLRADPGFIALLGLRGPELLRGGIDLQSADGSVVFQEFTRVKVEDAAALVGARPGPAPRFEAGISGSDVIGPEEAATLGVDASTVARDRRSLDLFGVPFAALTDRAQQVRTATDLSVEPPRWVVDAELSARGIIGFLDPRGPNGVWNGGTGDDVVDPLGEDCAAIFAGFPDVGCTALEVVSANLERWRMTVEILGHGRAFDPPETLAELQAMLDGDPSNDATGDPVAGPDGIRWNNFDANGDGVVADEVSETGDQKAAVSAANRIVVASFRDCLLGTAIGGPVSVSGGECYLNLDDPATRPLPPPVNGISASRDSLGRLIGLLPIGLRLNYRSTDDSTLNPSPNPNLSNAAFPFQRLTPREIQNLVLRGTIDVTRDAIFTPQDLADLQAVLGVAALPATIRLTAIPNTNLGAAFFNTLNGYDADNNAIRDVDENNDFAFDLLDDGLPGPTFAGNILCGSGVPGDVLQIAAQHELDSAQRALLASAYPDGFPPRSPVFCSSVDFLLALTGESSPGRRDFLWHGASQDRDEDGFADFVDVCPTIADPEQHDLDSDGVGDLCDNCAEIMNARIASPPPPPFTTSGGQRDDDADGFGNACDAKVTGGAVVGAADVAEFVVSIGKRRTRSVCGATRMRSCAIFDLDERSLLIGAPDVARLVSLLSRPAGPRCDACGDFLQLRCEGPACPLPAP